MKEVITVKKSTKIISFALVLAMFTPSVSFAEEFINAEQLPEKVSAVIAYELDRLKNTVNNISFDNFDDEVDEEDSAAEFKVSFVSSSWTLDDACAQTFAKELAAGTYGDVEITAITSSYVKFKIHKTNPILSGTVNMLKFQSNYTGSTYMSISVTR